MVFRILDVFCVFDLKTNQKNFDHANLGPHRPPCTSMIHRRGEAGVVAGWDVDNYEVMEQNLEGLTAPFPICRLRKSRGIINAIL